MGKFNFEEYRQPWETGPHWELKREFLEHYKDNFPEDRLLCLAQAYSNIQLLHCSYPAPVMVQIHELSKPLKGCKRFGGSQASQSDSSQNQKGKRKLHDSEILSKPKYKLIKFCSSSETLISESDHSKGEIQQVINEDKHFLVNTESRELKLSEKSANETPSIDHIKDEQPVSNRNERESENVKLIEKFSYQVQAIAHSINKPHSIFTETESQETRSIDKLLNQEKDTLKERHLKVMSIFKNAAKTLNKNKKLIKFKTTHWTSKNSDLKTNCYCGFHIDRTKISVGNGNSIETAQQNAIERALEIFINFRSTPSSSLKDILSKLQRQVEKKIPPLCSEKHTSLESLENNDLCMLVDFAKLLKTNQQNEKYVKLNTSEIINMTGAKMRISHCLAFETSPAPNSLFICDFSIKKISISKGKGRTKKQAKTEAAENGMKNLFNLLDHIEGNSSNNEGIWADDPLFNHTLISSFLGTNLINDNVIDSDSISSNSESTLITIQESEKVSTKSKPIPFILNKRLFENSIRMKFALYDRTELSKSDFSPADILIFSFQKSKMNMKYNVVGSEKGAWRCEILFGEIVVGTSYGSSQALAKTNAARSAYEKLKKEVYTIKVKMRPDDERDGFIIKRKDMFGLPDEPKVLSEENIGCKMLKMMGWSGGGIGKREGISEPIVVQSAVRGSGLGYGKEKGHVSTRTLLKNVEIILRDFAQSDSLQSLVFSPDFSKEERKHIHRIAGKYNLQGTSYGKDENEDRKLFIRRKYSVEELLTTLKIAGGSTDRYELIDLSNDI